MQGLHASFPKLGVLLWGPYKRRMHIILGTLFASPDFRKLPHLRVYQGVGYMGLCVAGSRT